MARGELFVSNSEPQSRSLIRLPLNRGGSESPLMRNVIPFRVHLIWKSCFFQSAFELRGIKDGSEVSTITEDWVCAPYFLFFSFFFPCSRKFFLFHSWVLVHAWPDSQLELKGINNPAMEIMTSKTEISPHCKVYGAHIPLTCNLTVFCSNPINFSPLQEWPQILRDDRRIFHISIRLVSSNTGAQI